MDDGNGYMLAMIATLAWMAGGLWLGIIKAIHPQVYVGGLIVLAILSAILKPASPW